MQVRGSPVGQVARRGPSSPRLEAPPEGAARPQPAAQGRAGLKFLMASSQSRSFALQRESRGHPASTGTPHRPVPAQAPHKSVGHSVSEATSPLAVTLGPGRGRAQISRIHSPGGPGELPSPALAHHPGAPGEPRDPQRLGPLQPWLGWVNVSDRG